MIPIDGTMVKVKVNLHKVNNVWALLAVIAAGGVAIFIYAIRSVNYKSIGIVALILTIGLLLLIVALLFKFIDKNPDLVQVQGKGKEDDHASDFTNTFQQVDIDSILSLLEERKKILITEEKWGELQLLELLIQRLMGASNRQYPDCASKSLREDRYKNLDRANSLLTDLLTQIRK